MLIDNNILNAFKAFVDAKGSLAAASRAVGIHYMLMRKYSTGEVKKLSDENWNKLEPHLNPYLSELPQRPPLLRVRGPSFPLLPGQAAPYPMKQAEIDFFLRLKKAGITYDVSAIKIAVIEKIAQLSDEECWKIGNLMGFGGLVARVVEEHTYRDGKEVFRDEEEKK